MIRVLYIVVLASLLSCRTTKSYVYTTDFIFENQTDSIFHVSAFFKDHLTRQFVVPNNTHVIFTEKHEHVPMNPGEFFSADSIEVALPSGRKLIYSWYRPSPTPKYLGNILGYTETIKDERYYVYQYMFTKTHIDSAR